MNFRWGRFAAATLTIFSLPISAQGQSGVQWQDIQRLLRQNGFSGVFENNDQSDWASNRALITFCRNLDCSKYEKKGPNPNQNDLESWNDALRQGIIARSVGNYHNLETVSARPVETKARFIDSGRKIVSFDGDDFSIWQADNFARLSFHRIGLSSESKWNYDLIFKREPGVFGRYQQILDNDHR